MITDSNLHEEIEFKNLDHSNLRLYGIKFELCTFVNCDFSKSDMAESTFIDCKFVNCNLSLANVNHTAFNNASFNKCKLLGIDFSKCRDFLLAFSFYECILSSCVFSNLKIGGTIFEKCIMHDTQFVNTELIGCSFDECDLKNTFFDHSNLEKADFRNALNFAIDPEINKMKGAKFSRIGLEGLLFKYKLDLS